MHFTVDSLDNYMVTSFNNTENDYNKKRSKLAIVAWRTFDNLEKEKVVTLVNEALATKVADVFEIGIKDFLADKDITLI